MPFIQQLNYSVATYCCCSKSEGYRINPKRNTPRYKRTVKMKKIIKMCSSNSRQPVKQPLNREMLMKDVGSEEQGDKDEAPFQESSGSVEDFPMEDDDDSDCGSSKKKNKKMVKKSKPKRKEKKMPKPRRKATVMPSPVKGKGKVGHPTAPKASKEKTPPKEEDEEPESAPEERTRARRLGTKGLKMDPSLGRTRSDNGLGRDFIFKKEGKKRRRKEKRGKKKKTYLS
ncbi:Nuclear ubiquitous casein and cyclin-dependent kinase substrate 1 [Camelus dromedarius]|uniref:Nuclear ubiquitous casein and cyclin-dependent kinase substrate 1 n=1 Tax=Camelus dromedarius TaxID=9838 RepID=A0A5N4CH85_CAMDR|nr:Nuclear ubiquitous casein and cyclin-dependent kinase substrate 1 [Camelus dromedarius]